MYLYILIGLALLLGLFIWSRSSSSSGGGCDGPTPKKLALFYSEKCPACNSFKSTWEQLKSAHEGDAGIVFLEIDVEKHPDERITAIPTLILDSDGEQFMFKDQRTLDKLEAFIKKN